MAFTAATCPTCLLQEYQHLSSAVCTMDKLQSTSSREKNCMWVKWFCRHHNLLFSCYLKRGIMLVDFFRIFKYGTMFFPLQKHTCNIWFCSVIFLTGEEAKTTLQIFTPSSSFKPYVTEGKFLTFWSLARLILHRSALTCKNILGSFTTTKEHREDHIKTVWTERKGLETLPSLTRMCDKRRVWIWCFRLVKPFFKQQSIKKWSRCV